MLFSVSKGIYYVLLCIYQFNIHSTIQSIIPTNKLSDYHREEDREGMTLLYADALPKQLPQRSLGATPGTPLHPMSHVDDRTQGPGPASAPVSSRLAGSCMGSQGTGILTISLTRDTGSASDG